MADVHSKAVRSYNMSRVKGRDTKPEILVRKYLHSEGFRFRIHVKHLPGKPDIVLPRYKTIIFIHGCFWHGHKECKYYVIPKTRTQWWLNKINNNIENDKIVVIKLTELGWKIINLWGCLLKPAKLEKTLLDLPQKIIS